MLTIDIKKIEDKIVSFILQKVKKAGFEKVIVGFSGGVDSAVSATLCAKTLGAKNVLAGLFPYDNLNPEELKDARLLTKHLIIPSENIFEINIKDSVDNFVTNDFKIGDIRRGNIMARVRMVYLFDLAKKHQALVCGTENKTEHLLGYFTRFGDAASDIEPILSLYKTQVYQLANQIKVPRSIIAKKPTAGLWKGQTDEGEFGFSYKDADTVLYLYFEKKQSIRQIKKIIDGFVVDRVLDRVSKNKFKQIVPFILE